MPSLHGGLWGSHVSLPTQIMWDTPVPLQILTGNMPLAAILGMSAIAQLWVIEDNGLAPGHPTPVLQVGKNAGTILQTKVCPP